MTTKRVLLAVAEPQMLVDINQALGEGWEATSAASEEEALAQFEKSSFDALLVDFNLGSTDASELLNQVLEKHPETNRFLFAYEADLALVAAKVNGTPHILPKPLEPGSLKRRIENGLTDANGKQNGSEPAAVPAETPKIPAIYSEVLKAMEAPGVTNEQVGEIIARDEDLTSQLLKLTNTSFLGLPRNFTRPIEAVETLGLEAVKTVVQALQFLAEHSGLKPGYLSIDQIWQHSVNVGQIARDLVLFETKDRALASQALVAGLVHDLGKVVLAKNFEDLYGRVLSLARKQPVALWDVEKEMFGANHGEIGGCLLGMWNMPGAIVDATALHHEPPLGEHNQLTALAAVHIANVLEREVWPSDDGMQVRPIISTPFLNQVGLLHRLPVWRAALANRRAVDLEPEPEARPAEPDQSPWTRSTTPAQSRTEGQTVSAAGFPWSWVWAGAAAVMGLVAFWFSTRPDVNNVELAYARTPSPYEARSVFSPIPVPQTAPAPATVQEKPSSPPAASETALKPTPSASTPAAVAATPTRTNETNGQPASVPLRKRPQPDFRFMGVIYTSNRPSAIVNGQTVNVGDHVDGATVLAISRNSVTLEIKGQRKLFELW